MDNIKDKKTEKVMGAPRKEIDYAVFERLCSILCTSEEIRSFFDMTDDTLNARCKEKYGMTFSEASKKFSADGKMSIRRKQFEIAMKGDTRMLIWLGKQCLDQKDKSEFSGVGGAPLVPPVIQFNSSKESIEPKPDDK